MESSKKSEGVDLCPDYSHTVWLELALDHLQQNKDSIYALCDGFDSMPTGTLYTVFLQFMFMRHKIRNVKSPRKQPWEQKKYHARKIKRPRPASLA